MCISNKGFYEVLFTKYCYCDQMNADNKLRIRIDYNLKACEILIWKPEGKDTNSRLVFGRILQKRDVWVEWYASEWNADAGSFISL